MYKRLSLMLSLMFVALVAADPERHPVGEGRVTEQEKIESKKMKRKVAKAKPLEKKVYSGFQSSKTYNTSHNGAFHNPCRVSLFGDEVELEDGSIWTVAVNERTHVLDWLVSDVILVTQNTEWFSSYDYQFVNVNTGQTARCNLHLGPFINGVYTHYVVGIDYMRREVVLEDGSLWKVSFWDGSLLDQWRINDIVIMGVNDDWFSMNDNSNILINIRKNYFVRMQCMY